MNNRKYGNGAKESSLHISTLNNHLGTGYCGSFTSRISAANTSSPASSSALTRVFQFTGCPSPLNQTPNIVVAISSGSPRHVVVMLCTFVPSRSSRRMYPKNLHRGPIFCGVLIFSFLPGKEMSSGSVGTSPG